MTMPTPADDLAIRQLFARYYRALDVGDTEGYLDCYTADARAYEEGANGIEIREGREEIRKLVLRFHERPDFPGHQHHFGNLIYEPDPEGRADCWVVLSYAMSTITRPGEGTIMHWSGHVRDVVVKQGDQYLLASKQIMAWGGEVLERFSLRG
ncbi:nuclear transport factor 2 family protein [Aurantiacibacter xanthus]|uniref:Nuclear transport factor 2 family protein n=1 Tax=Aurantiacibacter xanthus TaxID=1784712 RepID=A0A3A1P6P7_9SPHN|nr:nuclear transport factor 2 family protein [Aurantiacibacter xanthus]RIV83001.1 nuclear transport factor 2 family protein [Aurantiacibacter xanthus]